MIDEQETALEAFAAIGARSARMMGTGAPSDAIELVVVDDTGVRVARPGAQ